MRQSIIAFILFSVSISFASTKEISKIYANFNKQKTELLKADLDKKNIKSKVESTYQNLSRALEELKKIESKSKNDLLTPEGNEMAYDLEVLQPLKNLATGLMTKEDCTKARHEHQLNFPVLEDENSQAIENIINKICG